MANAKEMVRILTAALTKNVGVNQISVDGQTISFASRQQMIEELLFWERRVASESGTRRLFRSINIGSAY